MSNFIEFENDSGFITNKLEFTEDNEDISVEMSSSWNEQFVNINLSAEDIRKLMKFLIDIYGEEILH